MSNLDINQQDKQTGTKRDFDQVSPGSICSPDSKITFFCDSPVQSNMAESPSTEESSIVVDQTPNWFKHFDCNLDERLSRLIDQRLSLKLANITESVEKVTDVAEKTVAHVKILEKKVEEVNIANQTLRDRLDDCESKLD